MERALCLLKGSGAAALHRFYSQPLLLLALPPPLLAQVALAPAASAAAGPSAQRVQLDEELARWVGERGWCTNFYFNSFVFQGSSGLT